MTDTDNPMARILTLLPETDEEERAFVAKMNAGEFTYDELDDICRCVLFPGWIRGFARAAVESWEDDAAAFRRKVVVRIVKESGVAPVRGKVLTSVTKGRTLIRGKKDAPATVYPAVVLGDQRTLVVEILLEPRREDVRKFADKTLPKFSQDFPDLTAKRKVYGALAFQLADDETRALARESGLMLLQVGERKGVKVLNPDPSKLRPLAG